MTTPTVNFAFLPKHDPVLVKLAALAERFVFEDPNTALIKIRQLGETLAKTVAGNRAVHELQGDRREAFHQLKLARQLAVWFHKTVTRNTNFKAGPFIPPPANNHSVIEAFVNFMCVSCPQSATRSKAWLKIELTQTFKRGLLQQMFV